MKTLILEVNINKTTTKVTFAYFTDRMPESPISYHNGTMTRAIVRLGGYDDSCTIVDRDLSIRQLNDIVQRVKGITDRSKVDISYFIAC